MGNLGSNAQILAAAYSALKEVHHGLRILKKFSLNISGSSFVTRVNLLHPLPSPFLYDLLLSLWCFSVVVNYWSGFLQFKDDFFT